MNDNGHSTKSGWIRSALDRFEGDLLRYAQRILGDAGRAEEVVQDTFLQLCKKPPEALNGELAPWLYRVCRNRSFDVKRKEQRMTTTVDGQLSLETTSDAAPDVRVEQSETSDTIARLMGDLPDNQREVIRLKFQSGLTYRQIAEVTGLSASNVGFLIHTGITTLRKQMTDRLHE
jgi:RNA polymerase sigma factor (sigma-70 family)